MATIQRDQAFVSWWRAAAAGVLAGGVGTAVMTLAEKLEQQRTGRHRLPGSSMGPCAALASRYT